MTGVDCGRLRVVAGPFRNFSMSIFVGRGFVVCLLVFISEFSVERLAGRRVFSLKILTGFSSVGGASPSPPFELSLGETHVLSRERRG